MNLFLIIALLMLPPVSLQARQSIITVSSELAALNKITRKGSSEQKSCSTEGKLETTPVTSPAVIATDKAHQGISVNCCVNVNHPISVNVKTPVSLCEPSSGRIPAVRTEPPIENNYAHASPPTPTSKTILKERNSYTRSTEDKRDTNLPFKNNVKADDFMHDKMSFSQNSLSVIDPFILGFHQYIYSCILDESLYPLSADISMDNQQQGIIAVSAGKRCDEERGLEQSLLVSLVSAWFISRCYPITIQRAFGIKQSIQTRQYSKGRQVTSAIPGESTSQCTGKAGGLPPSSNSSFDQVNKQNNEPDDEGDQDGNGENPRKRLCRICGRKFVMSSDNVCQACNPSGSDSDAAPVQYPSQDVVDYLVACAGAGYTDEIEKLLTTYGSGLLFMPSKPFPGDTALHAAYKNGKIKSIDIIKRHCLDDQYEQLTQVINEQGKKPEEVTSETTLMDYVLWESSLSQHRTVRHMPQGSSVSSTVEVLQEEAQSVGQSIVNAFVFCITDGRSEVINDILERHGVKLLALAHSNDPGDTALHAAFRYNNKLVVAIIKKYCDEHGYDYDKLTQIKNKEGKTPGQLSSVATGSDVSVDKSGEEDIFACLGTPKVTQETLDKVNQYTESESLHRGADTGRSVLIQSESLGKHPCIVHENIFHGFAKLTCCSSGDKPVFICINQIIYMVKKILQRKYEEVACPKCEAPVDILSLLKSTIENLENEKYLSENKKKVLIDKCRDLTIDYKERQRLRRSNYYETGGIDNEIEDKKTLINFCNQIISSLDNYFNLKRIFQKTVKAVGRKECIVCLDNRECFCFSNTECQHWLCMECMKQHINVSSTTFDSLAHGFVCPGTECEIVIPEHVVEFMEGQKTLNKINRQLMQLAARNNKNLFACLNQECDSIVDVGCGTINKLTCLQCSQISCVKCLVTPFHEDLSCAAYQSALTSEGAEASFQAAKKKEPTKYKNCPICAAELYKDAGCNHMSCKSCKNYFCWLCLKETGKNYEHFKRGECDLYRNDLMDGSNNQTLEYVYDLQPSCQRCGSENFETLLCGHFACNLCQSHMIREIEELGGDIFCGLCLTGKSGNRNRRPLPNLHREEDLYREDPDERGYLLEATGFTPAGNKSQYNFPVDDQKAHGGYDQFDGIQGFHSSITFDSDIRECIICRKTFRDESLDVCLECIEEYLIE